MDDNDLRKRLSDVTAAGLDRDAVLVSMQRRETTHTRLAIAATAGVVVVMAGGIGLAATGALGGRSDRQPAATVTTSGATPSGPTAPVPDPATASRTTDSGGSGQTIGDFEGDSLLNETATEVAAMLTAAIENEPNYAGVRIIRSGVELSIVGTLTPAESFAVADARVHGTGQLTDIAAVPSGSQFPITVRRVRYTMKQLSTIVAQITSDTALADRGITVSAVGVDVDKNIVDLSVVPYSEQIERLIHDKYGAAVLVRTKPIIAAGS
jgi:hypothetical protein